jgi:hypothetical protein
MVVVAVLSVIEGCLISSASRSPVTRSIMPLMIKLLVESEPENSRIVKVQHCERKLLGRKREARDSSGCEIDDDAHGVRLGLHGISLGFWSGL